jgi:hypothetical protein
MARTAPTVLLQHVYDNDKAIEICEADFTYGVYYKAKPFLMKTYQSLEHPYPGPKYPRVNFQNIAHAFNLSDKLNALYNCNDFSVVRLDSSRELKRP